MAIKVDIDDSVTVFPFISPSLSFSTHSQNHRGRKYRLESFHARGQAASDERQTTRWTILLITTIMIMKTIPNAIIT